MRVFMGGLDFELEWLDGKDMPQIVLDYACNAIQMAAERMGPGVAHDIGAMEHSAQMVETGVWYYSMVESDGSGIMHVRASSNAQLVRQLMNDYMARHHGKAAKSS